MSLQDRADLLQRFFATGNGQLTLPPPPRSARLAMMESLLTWRHLAPTAPDTLTCYPFQDRDPFVLEATPHVFFVGNQPAFKTTTVTGVLADPLPPVCTLTPVTFLDP